MGLIMPQLITPNPQHGARQLELTHRLAQRSARLALVAIGASGVQLFEILSRRFGMRDKICGTRKSRFSLFIHL